MELLSPNTPTQPMLLADRPVVEEIVSKIRMSKNVAKQLFPALIFGETETHAIITEIMRPAKPGEAIVCVHGASGQKFAVDHYELDGVPL